jgi:hypothetical protein
MRGGSNKEIEQQTVFEVVERGSEDAMRKGRPYSFGTTSECS